jgi:hypothetical protein
LRCCHTPCPNGRREYEARLRSYRSGARRRPCGSYCTAATAEYFYSIVLSSLTIIRAHATGLRTGGPDAACMTGDGSCQTLHFTAKRRFRAKEGSISSGQLHAPATICRCLLAEGRLRGFARWRRASEPRTRRKGSFQFRHVNHCMACRFVGFIHQTTNVKKQVQASRGSFAKPRVWSSSRYSDTWR